MPEQSRAQVQEASWRSLTRRLVSVLLVAMFAWLLTAYLMMPMGWRLYLKKNPELREIPGITSTNTGIPGDPLNVALVGTESQVAEAMKAAGWFPADAISLRSSLKIATGTVFNKPYEEAPVSHLYLFGRDEDLAFEKPVGSNPRKRHHVRFWLTDRIEDGRPVWMGAATYDERVGLSHTTGQITHHIDGDVDAERNELLGDLKIAGRLKTEYRLESFHPSKEGRNGGGDKWFTDRALGVGVIGQMP